MYCTHFSTSEREHFGKGDIGYILLTTADRTHV
jgi:hypothetical protein